MRTIDSRTKTSWTIDDLDVPEEAHNAVGIGSAAPRPSQPAHRGPYTPRDKPQESTLVEGLFIPGTPRRGASQQQSFAPNTPVHKASSSSSAGVPHASLDDSSGVRRKPTSEEIVAKWCSQRNPQTQQLVGVIRHAERGDYSWATVQGQYWHTTDDATIFPLDPPLSDNGRLGARKIGQLVRKHAEDCGTEIHTVVCSPFLRCVQTAIGICCELGPGTRFLIDHALGEVYGPCVMGPIQPKTTRLVRPKDKIMQLCESHGLICEPRFVGDMPTWPEDLRAARRRFARRFLIYIRRSMRVRRNFVLVSHADCVGAAMSMMPSELGSVVEKVEPGGMFIAHRLLERAQGHRSEDSLCPLGDEIEDVAEEVNLDRDGWRVQTHLIKKVPREESQTYVLEQRLKDVVDNQVGDKGLSLPLIEQLLLSNLSDVPLGENSGHFGVNIEIKRKLQLSRSMSLGNSTLLFGASNDDDDDKRSTVSDQTPSDRVSSRGRRKKKNQSPGERGSFYRNVSRTLSGSLMGGSASSDLSSRTCSSSDSQSPLSSPKRADVKKTPSQRTSESVKSKGHHGVNYVTSSAPSKSPTKSQQGQQQQRSSGLRPISMLSGTNSLLARRSQAFAKIVKPSFEASQAKPGL